MRRFADANGAASRVLAQVVRRQGSFASTILESRSKTAPQSRQTVANLKAALEASGRGFDVIVDITRFHVRMNDHLDTFAATMHEIFPRPPFRIWTAVGVVKLADPDLLFEIKAIASLASSK